MENYCMAGVLMMETGEQSVPYIPMSEDSGFTAQMIIKVLPAVKCA